jgi:hypothetical protein
MRWLLESAFEKAGIINIIRPAPGAHVEAFTLKLDYAAQRRSSTGQ